MNMSKTFWLAALAFAVTAATAFAQVPGIIQYQGRVTSNGTNFTGTGQFKFAIIETIITGSAVWNNAGVVDALGEPVKSVPVAVNDGLFIVGLGDTTLGNMLTIPASVFSYENLKLRIWFSDGVGAFAALSPDQKITSVGFAMKAAIAATVSDGAITSDKIADGAVLGPKIGANAITSVEIADTLTLQRLDLGGPLWNGTLNLWAAGANESRGLLTGDNTGSELQLRFADSSTGAVLSAKSTGQLSLRNSVGSEGLNLKSSVNGGDLTMRNGAGNLSLLLTGDHNEAGRIQARKPDGVVTAEILGSATASTGGRMTLRRAEGHASVIVDAENGTSGGARVALTTGGGTTSAELLAAETADSGAELRLGRANGTTTVVIDAENDAQGGPRLELFTGGGVSAMVLLPGGGDASLGGGGLMRLGDFTGSNLAIDDNEIIARKNGVSSPLFLNYGYTGVVHTTRMAINTATPAAGYALSVNGKVICEELVVQDSANWPDYVFADDYDLMPLEEVEASIQKHKHLPGIASAKKIGEDGIPLGQIQKQMMEKIEELTLHLIQQNKRLAAQEAELGKLRSRLDVVK